MSAIRTYYTAGYYSGFGAAEESVVFQKVRLGTEAAKPPLVFCHQHGGTTPVIWAADSYQRLFRALAEDYTVMVADLGTVVDPFQDTWGNSTHRQRVNACREGLSTYFDSTGPVTLIGTSMGGCGALNYAKFYGATEVAAVALCIPLINLADLQHRPAVDGAYGGAYSDGVYGAVHNPYIYRASYPSSTIPTALWTASNDTAVLPADAQAFLTSNPQAGHRSVGPLGHGLESIEASVDGIINWVRGDRRLIREPV